MESIAVLQIVGYKNSGKTTLLAAWIEALTTYHIQAAVIKHHGHSSGLAMPDRATDSMRLLEKGAISSLAYDGETIQLHMNRLKPSLLQLVEMAKLSSPDVIFIEGFKAADYPKVVLIRSAADWETLQYLSNIQAVFTNESVELELFHDHSFPVVVIGKCLKQANQFLRQWLQENRLVEE